MPLARRLFLSARRLSRAIRKRFTQALARAELILIGVKLAGSVILYGRPIVDRVEGSEIAIGERVVLCSWSTWTALGVNHPVILRTLRPGARICIGNDVGISGGSICAAIEVSIGSETMLGANVTIADTDFHPLNPENRRYTHRSADSARVRIGKNVFVGTNAIILKGVEIGDNCVIGAGSVVTRSIPAGAVAAGSPCRVLRLLTDPAVTQSS